MKCAKSCISNKYHYSFEYIKIYACLIHLYASSFLCVSMENAFLFCIFCVFFSFACIYFSFIFTHERYRHLWISKWYLFIVHFYLTASAVVVLAQIFEIFLIQQDSALFVYFRYFHHKHHVKSNQIGLFLMVHTEIIFGIIYMFIQLIKIIYNRTALIQDWWSIRREALNWSFNFLKGYTW